jgi:hypothetical protein
MDGVGVTIQGPDADFEVYTNPAGGLFAPLETGVEYRITPLDDVLGAGEVIEMGTENRAMDFIIEVETFDEDEGDQPEN